MSEGIRFGEIGDRLAGHVDPFLFHGILGHLRIGKGDTHLGIPPRQVVVILDRDRVDEFPVPELGVAAFVEEIDGITIRLSVIHDKAAFVDFVRIDSLLSGELKVLAIGRDLEKGNLAFRFDDADAIGSLPVDEEVIEMSDTEIARLDVGMVRIGIEMSRNCGTLFDEGFLGSLKNLCGRLEQWIGIDLVRMGQLVLFERFKRFQETVGEQLRFLVLKTAEVLRGAKSFLAEGIPDLGEGHAGEFCFGEKYGNGHDV